MLVDQDGNATTAGRATEGTIPMKEISIVVVTPTLGEVGRPDDWIPPLEVQQLVVEAGYDPDELIEEIADWYEGRVIPVSDAA
jgi:hypothetical protein